MKRYGDSRLWQKCIEVFGFPSTWDLSSKQATELMTHLDKE